MFVSGFLYGIYKSKSSFALVKDYTLENYVTYDHKTIFKVPDISGLSDDDIKIFVDTISGIDEIIDINVIEKDNDAKPQKK